MRSQVMAVALLTLSWASTSSAAVIEYTATNVAGTTWQYDYTVTNGSLAAGIEQFTVWFGFGDYADLSLVGSPAGWDSLVLQPDPGIPDEGFFDSLALGVPLALGASVNGFSVSFTWLGVGIPGRQAFDIVDPLTFAVLQSGQTFTAETPPGTQVPEPGTAALLGLALVGLRLMKRKTS